MLSRLQFTFQLMQNFRRFELKLFEIFHLCTKKAQDVVDFVLVEFLEIGKYVLLKMMKQKMAYYRLFYYADTTLT